MTCLIRSESDFAPTSRATPNRAVVTEMADTVRKFCFQTDVAGGVQLDARFLVLLVPRPNCVLQDLNFVLFPPRKKNEKKRSGQ